MRVGLIGNGGIAKSCRVALAGHEVTFVTLVKADVDFAEQEDGANKFVGSMDALLAKKPSIVVEAAGHNAVRLYGEMVLEAGIPLMIVSIGVLADGDFYTTLQAAAARGGSRLILVSGAVGGLDALEAARLGGLDTVCYRAIKPVFAWRGTHAETLVNLDSIASAQSFFRGTAREAAMKFPQNSNVAAAIALAGIGFEQTEVELVADPQSQRNIHEIAFDGADGRCRFEIAGNPSPDNPKTSMLTAHSVARAILDFRVARGVAA